MRKIFTLLVLSVLATPFQLNAQCSDLSSYNNPAIYPGSELEFCDQASANQDLIIVLNEDTTLFGFTATVEKVHLDDITNLPNGMTFTCGSTNCDYFPADGLIKICVTFSGNIDDASYGTDSPVITGDIDYNVTSGPVTGPGSLNDQTLPYDFDFTVLDETDSKCVAASVESSSEELMTIYPNPVSTNGFINVSEPSDVEIIDFLGNSVYSGTVNGTLDLSQLDLASGVYFVRAKNNTGQHTKKFVVK